MKKFILSLLLTFVCLLGASAQVIDNGSAKDNWYIGGGLGTQIWSNSNSWEVFNPWKNQSLNIHAFGGKYFTPYVGVEADVNALFNTGAESNFIDGHRISVNGVANLSNIVAGYKGTRHFFDLEALAGIGWNHVYQTGKDANGRFMRLAFRGNFNVSKNLAVYVMPEYTSMGHLISNTNLRPHAVGLYAGVKWNIPSKRGNFPVVRIYDIDEVNKLKGNIAKLNDEVGRLSSIPAKTIVKYVETPEIKYVNKSYSVLFDQGDATVGDLSTVAEAVKGGTSLITIVAGTSPEGAERLNQDLAAARAEAVKQALIKAGVNPTRIVTNTEYYSQRRAVIVVSE